MPLRKSGEDYSGGHPCPQKEKGHGEVCGCGPTLEGVQTQCVPCGGYTKKGAASYSWMENHFLHLTDLGREVAEDTYEKHLFFTEILVAAGVDPVTAERDACRIEHVVSKETFERLKATRKLSGKAVISSDES